MDPVSRMLHSVSLPRLSASLANHVPTRLVSQLRLSGALGLWCSQRLAFNGSRLGSLDEMPRPPALIPSDGPFPSATWVWLSLDRHQASGQAKLGAGRTRARSAITLTTPGS